MRNHLISNTFARSLGSETCVPTWPSVYLGPLRARGAKRGSITIHDTFRATR